MNGEMYGAARQSYATWDPRKQGERHQYDEIPYGDGPGPRGPVPDVPADYAQVPAVPQRLGALPRFLFVLFLGVDLTPPIF